VCKKLIKNSQPFGKKFSENRRGIDSHLASYTGLFDVYDVC